MTDRPNLPPRYGRRIERDHAVVQEGVPPDRRRTVALGDVAEIVMGQSPPGDSVSADHGVPLLNGPTEFGAHHPTPEQYTTDPRKLARTGDLLFCVRGSTTGRMNWADQEYAIGRGVAAIRHRDEPALQPFVRGAIEVELPELLTQATGSTFPNISARQLAAVPYPNLRTTEQRAIARILGALDDKIELNRRMSATLEAMARALFKSWFVDFEPVRAKMEGRPSGLPPALDALFPASFEASELGQIPSGWGVRSVADLCTRIENGGTPSRAARRYWGGPIDWFKTSELVDEPLLSSGEKITSEGLAGSSCKLWEVGTVLIALYASPTVGRLGILETPATSNQACCALLAKPAFGNLFLFYSLVSTRERLRRIAVGSAQQNISQRIVREHRVVVPPQGLAGTFQDSVETLYCQKVHCQRESESLASQRDALLPRLVSGEVRVGARSEDGS